MVLMLCLKLPATFVIAARLRDDGGDDGIGQPKPKEPKPKNDGDRTRADNVVPSRHHRRDGVRC